LAALALVAGCFRRDPAVGDCGALLRGDRGAREQQVIEEFNTYPLETRYRLYICGSQAAHTPWGLEEPFAEGGEEAARFLERKLEATEYDATISDIIAVFWIMRQRGTFDATSDPALMALLERKVASLDGAMRENGEWYLQGIRDGPVVRPAAVSKPTNAAPSSP
jgi:hypothetical protein